jgi:hypothetical protein
MGVDPSPAGIYEDSVLVPDAAPPEPEETAPEVRFGGLFLRRDRKKKKTRDSDFDYDRVPPDAPETLAPSSKKLRLWNELAKPVVYLSVLISRFCLS